MQRLGERMVIYTALLVLCGLTGVAVAPAAGALSFFQVVVIIELIYWLARPAGKTRRQSGH